MKKGKARFDFYLGQFELLLKKSASHRNPALWLYQNDARTILFMLEGLSRLYQHLHNKKKFAKLKDNFKLLEDILGAIDYYDTFAIEFKKNTNIPAAVKNYLTAKKSEKTKHFNEILINKKWLDNSNSRIKKIQKKLAGIDWMNETDEIQAIYDFYGEAIYKIKTFIQQTKFHFDNVESDVHELRRKLRWLSIYPQALRGCIQLKKDKTTPKHLVKYLTKEIINSPFNKLPSPEDCKVILYFNEKYFFSLSWMIEELGKLKDEGLRIVILKEALQHNNNSNDETAFSQAIKMLGSKQVQTIKLLKKSEKICNTYFRENNLECLVERMSKKF